MRQRAVILIAAGLPLSLGACEFQTKETLQNGYRGTGMDTIKVAAASAANDVPPPPYAPPGEGGPAASTLYKNVPVLGGLSNDQFNYTMAAITNWVAPAQGCNYCHNPADMASDEKYPKIVARRMLQMNMAINANWANHVGQTGVTCWTCHRGQNIPNDYWTLATDQRHSIVGNRRGQNAPVSNSAYSSLPNSALESYLQGLSTPEDVRVVSKTAHPTIRNRLSVMDAERSYAMMTHISQALGVNCTYCHNAQSFQQWSSSNPPRQTAWYGVRMVRELNGQYLTPLANILPANRKGAGGDSFKINCATCHQGQNKPLGGISMVKDYPALRGGGKAGPAPAATPVPAAAPATAAR